MKNKALLVSIICTIIAIFFLVNYLVREKHREKKVDEFCTRLKRVEIEIQVPALAPNYELQWPNNQKLKVYICDSSGPITARLLKVSNEWGKYCGISFIPGAKIYSSQIRVTFKSGGYASAVGIESMQKEYLYKPTLFLERLDTCTDDALFKRVVLHEFGHALGIEHELRKPSAKIPWDTSAVYEYYKKHYKWNKTDVNNEIFKPFTVPKPYQDFDSSSIMTYAVPDTITIGTYSIDWPKQLSESDKKFINKWYPKY